MSVLWLGDTVDSPRLQVSSLSCTEISREPSVDFSSMYTTKLVRIKYTNHGIGVDFQVL